MKYYRVKILTAYHNGLNESVSKVPMDFYVKCKNNETINECFAKISRKFKNRYNITIKSADIKQVNEGFFSRVGAGLKAIGAGAVQPIKNIGHGLAAVGKAAVGNKEGAKASIDKTKSIKQGAKDSQKKSLLKMVRKEIINSFNDLYGSDEDYNYNNAALKKIIKAVEYFFDHPV